MYKESLVYESLPWNDRSTKIPYKILSIICCCKEGVIHQNYFSFALFFLQYQQRPFIGVSKTMLYFDTLRFPWRLQMCLSSSYDLSAQRNQCLGIVPSVFSNVCLTHCIVASGFSNVCSRDTCNKQRYIEGYM
jgi:hypothetical protein